MSVYRVSYRYANSLFKLSIEKNIFDRVSKDIELVYHTFAESRELRALLKNPVIKPSQKNSILSEIFKDKVSSEIISFFSFVIDKNRENILYEILKEFLVICDSKNGILRANIKSASELSTEVRKKLTDTLESKTNKKVEASFSLDKNLIGGFTVKIEDTVYDASVKQQLQNLRKKFAEEVTIN